MTEEGSSVVTVQLVNTRRLRKLTSMSSYMLRKMDILNDILLACLLWKQFHDKIVNHKQCCNKWHQHMCEVYTIKSTMTRLGSGKWLAMSSHSFICKLGQFRQLLLSTCFRPYMVRIFFVCIFCVTRLLH